MSQQSEYKGNTPQHNKGHIIQSTSNITLNNEKMKAFPLRSGTTLGFHFLPLSFSLVLEVLVSANTQEK